MASGHPRQHPGRPQACRYREKAMDWSWSPGTDGTHAMCDHAATTNDHQRRQRDHGLLHRRPLGPHRVRRLPATPGRAHRRRAAGHVRGHLFDTPDEEWVPACPPPGILRRGHNRTWLQVHSSSPEPRSRHRILPPTGRQRPPAPRHTQRSPNGIGAGKHGCEPAATNVRKSGLRLRR